MPAWGILVVLELVEYCTEFLEIFTVISVIDPVQYLCHSWVLLEHTSTAVSQIDHQDEAPPPAVRFGGERSPHAERTSRSKSGGESVGTTRKLFTQTD
jgi:hypothetical protein